MINEKLRTTNRFITLPLPPTDHRLRFDASSRCVCCTESLNKNADEHTFGLSASPSARNPFSTWFIRDSTSLIQIVPLSAHVPAFRPPSRMRVRSGLRSTRLQKPPEPVAICGWRDGSTWVRHFSQSRSVKCVGYAWKSFWKKQGHKATMFNTILLLWPSK